MSSADVDPRTLARWGRVLFRDLSQTWDVPELTTTRLEISPRMRRSLGRCYPRRPLIRINPVLLKRENRQWLRETLIHEAAHVAAYQLGARETAHGPIWQSLMQRAGVSPRATVSDERIGFLPEQRPARFLHRCRDCGVEFRRRRTDRRWRCAACLQAGRRGRLEVLAG